MNLHTENKIFSDQSHDLKKPKLDQQCLGGIAGSIVNTILKCSEADASALLSQLLTGFGNVIGSSAHYLTEDDRQAGNLFVLNVGDSAKARKGTSWGRVSKLLKDADPDWFKQRIRSGLSSGEGFVDSIRDESVEKGISGVADKRLLCVEGEFASLLKVASREGNTISAHLRNAWDGKDLAVMTKNTPLFASNPHVSIIGHITSFELRKLLNQTEITNGLGNRFLFFFVQRSKMLPHGGSIDPNDYSLMINELRASIDFAKKQSLLIMSEQAAAYWEYLYPRITIAKPGLYGSLVARSEPQIIRLALLQALMNRKPKIEQEHIETANAIFNYCAESVRYIFGYQTGSSLADKIKEMLDEAPGGLTRTEVRDKTQKNYSKESLDTALRLLKESDLAYCIYSDPTGGRPSEIWKSTRYSN